MGRPRNKDIQDVWPRRARFLKCLDAKLADGVTYAEIAEALELGSTRSLEHEWRYDRSREPGRNTLRLATVYFGKPPLEFEGPETEDDFGNQMGVFGKNMAPETRAAMLAMAEASQIKGIEKKASEAEVATGKNKTKKT
jgi:transcriptional regulator with XRE-family HTH domain